MISPLTPSHSFSFNGCRFDFFSAKKGEGLPRHEHVFPHITFCVSGELRVVKENTSRKLVYGDNAILLKAFEWHELVAESDDTAFFNVSAVEMT